ncbi:MAG TPA: extracellular solute-binding protein [Gemmatimonadales bacterium]|jgi:iron(III) transport system substrate-binding protein|nr:extracellular solute-binding protein [Gemmatimonadales bacterium]
MSRKLALLLLVITACSGDHRTPLVIYSPHGRDLLTLFEKRFEALHPDIDVRWLDMGSQDVYDRVRSERANPQGDIWFGGPSLIFAQAAQDSLLDCARAAWADAIPARGRGAGDCYLAAYETPVVFLYAEKVMSAAAAPQDWDDLLAPQWTGKIIIRDPLASGTMRAVFGMIVQRGMKQNGDTTPGFAWLRRLDGQTKVYEQNPALVSEKIARQEGLVTIWDLPDVLISRRRGMPIGYVFPKSGTVAIEDGIAVVRNTKHLAAARAFVDFVGTPEMQLAAAREVFRVPARLDLPPDSLPEWVRDVRRRMVVADVDWNLLARHGAEWMQWWDQHVRGTGKPR